jgi:hypothetical protein
MAATQSTLSPTSGSLDKDVRNAYEHRGAGQHVHDVGATVLHVVRGSVADDRSGTKSLSRPSEAHAGQDTRKSCLESSESGHRRVTEGARGEEVVRGISHVWRRVDIAMRSGGEQRHAVVDRACYLLNVELPAGGLRRSASPVINNEPSALTMTRGSPDHIVESCRRGETTHGRNGSTRLDPSSHFSFSHIPPRSCDRVHRSGFVQIRDITLASPSLIIEYPSPVTRHHKNRLPGSSSSTFSSASHVKRIRCPVYSRLPSFLH